MLEIFRDASYDFQGKRRVAFIISAILIVIGIIATVVRGGPNYSIDFTGGLQSVLRFETPVDQSDVRDAVHDLGYTDAEVKTITGRGQQDVMIRIPILTGHESVSDELQAGLQAHFADNPITVRSVETVGPKIGRELRNSAILAIVASMFFIVIYISWRFKYRYAIAALAALIHDVLIVFGLFSILNLQISLAVIAAFLTIVGYSLNDTIVVFDRVRENVRKLRTKGFQDQINISINETLSRTVLTSGTTFIVVFILYLFGGAVLHDFAFALMAGVIVGTYSSIFVASPILIEWANARPEKRSKKQF
ncbi:MAG TPA: protein translocase subunit SecF [Bacteroidetes bacterium]|nr:protein translocase subunit SecF [Bacteroidota bacterium]HEX04290.1 protein translocase subunit SecF [Bacteroidota bacterium]